jgi:hypothetical protein
VYRLNYYGNILKKCMGVLEEITRRTTTRIKPLGWQDLGEYMYIMGSSY